MSVLLNPSYKATPTFMTREDLETENFIKRNILDIKIEDKKPKEPVREFTRDELLNLGD